VPGPPLPCQRVPLPHRPSIWLCVRCSLPYTKQPHIIEPPVITGLTSGRRFPSSGMSVSLESSDTSGRTKTGEPLSPLKLCDSTRYASTKMRRFWSGSVQSTTGIRSSPGSWRCFEVTNGKISLFAAQKLKKANRVGKIPTPMFIFVNYQALKGTGRCGWRGRRRPVNFPSLPAPPRAILVASRPW
jgi:hypothetical protein